MKRDKEWIYKTSTDNTSRYILGTKGKKTIFVLGINPSIAEPTYPTKQLKVWKELLNTTDMTVG